MMTENLSTITPVFFIRTEHMEIKRGLNESTIMNPDAERLPAYIHCGHQQKKGFNSGQSLKLQAEKEREQTEMGEAPQGIELSDIPFKCTGIKPGVKPPLLFRLDATKQRAIWQTVRPLNTVCSPQLLYLHCLS